MRTRTAATRDAPAWVHDVVLAAALARRVATAHGGEQPAMAGWEAQRRPSQAPPPGPWRVWLLMAGRGFGKTRAGAEWVREQVMCGQMRRVALVAPTAADARDVMVEGESGILAVCDRYRFRPEYQPSRRRLIFPNGAVAYTYSADKPDRLRGPQHDGAWCDELASWRYLDQAWANLQFGLRLGADPRIVATTTPRRVPLLRALLAEVATGRVALTHGTSYENLANLAPAYRDMIAQYEGTALGRQEIFAELLETVEGALWLMATIEEHRRPAVPAGVELVRVVVAVDPPASRTGAECGIVVAARGSDGHVYVLDDLSRRAAPLEWATAAVAAYDRHQADAVVIEVNQGGEMATETLRRVRPHLPVRPVHASRGKHLRAEPVSALYQQGRVHHVGMFPALEDQLTTWVPGDSSPDRLDALVYAVTELVLRDAPAVTVPPVTLPYASPWNTGGQHVRSWP